MEPTKIGYERPTSSRQSRDPTESGHDKPSILISWEGVRFKIKSKSNADSDGFTEIIHGVNGAALPGQVLAVMGSSGAGKTTLLNVLSDRLARPKNTKIEGTVRANGQEISSIDYKSYVGYVMQDDVLLETMTPRECLRFSAHLRLRGSEEHKEKRVRKLLKQLKLKDVADNRIGSELKRGLSGGERRRVSIAVELIVNPSVIFLDGTPHVEPTSGLDSTNALNVMILLDSLAKTGITVITTIHQPSIEIFSLFNKLILMVEGHIVYQGPAELSSAHFQQLGFVRPPLISEPDFYMKILHIANREEKTEDESSRLDTFVTHYSREFEQLQAPTSFLELSTNEDIYRASVWTQFRWLLRRAFLSIVRSPVTTYIRFTQDTVYTTLMILVFNHMNLSYSGIQDRRGLLFFLEICMIQGAVLDVILAFPLERALFLKEQAQSLYGVLPYFCSKIVSELPMNLLTPLGFASAVYFGTGLSTVETSTYFIFGQSHTALLMLLLHGIGESIGLVIGAFISDPSFAPTLGFVLCTQILVVPFMMFGGYFTNINSIPVSFYWVSYFSVSNKQPYRYGFEALCRNEFTELDLDCATCPTLQFPPGLQGGICVPCDPIATARFRLGLWENIYVLIGFYVGLRALALLALKSRVKKLGS